MKDVVDTDLPLITHVVGARPNIMKLGPLWHELARSGAVRQRVVHTGQHWDGPLSGELFEDFGLPEPDVNLQVGGMVPVMQFAAVIERLAAELTAHRPALTVTYGDVRSTPAAAICSHHLGIATAHYEGGLRTFTRIWSEEFHRIAADAYSELVFTTEPTATENCERERGGSGGVHEVGDLMCDAARMLTEGMVSGEAARKYGMTPPYALFTSHHSNNVDSAGPLAEIVGIVEMVAARLPVLFPVHPRTRKNLETFGLWDRLVAIKGLSIAPPIRYAEFIRLVRDSEVVVTDSGSLCAECVYLRRPMLYLHPVNEHEQAEASGAVRVVGRDRPKVKAALDWALGSGVGICPPQTLDGRAAPRMAGVLLRFLGLAAAGGDGSGRP